MSKFDASVTTKRKNKEEEEQKALGKVTATFCTLFVKCNYRLLVLGSIFKSNRLTLT